MTHTGPNRSTPLPELGSERPRYRLAEDTFPLAIRRQLAKQEQDPVDVQAALAWLNGEGPNPWTEGSH